VQEENAVMRVILIATALLLVGGCAIGYKKTMTADMQALTGEPVREVIARIGYPKSKSQTAVAGDVVYVWEDNGCTLTVGVDSSERVTHADYDGDHSDCKPYRKKLEGK